jgi:alkylation response protein AidB-like acyl-CoA dehydrogenase
MTTRFDQIATRCRRVGALALAATWLLTAQPATAQGADPFAGVWQLNVEKSVYEAGRPPKSFTRTYEDRGGGVVLLTVESVSSAGASTRVHLVYKRDGKPYPESTLQARVIRMVAVRAVDASTEEVRVVDGRSETGNTLTVSRDRQTLTQTMKGVTADGRPFTNVIVYEKQQ